MYSRIIYSMASRNFIDLKARNHAHCLVGIRAEWAWYLETLHTHGRALGCVFTNRWIFLLDGVNGGVGVPIQTIHEPYRGITDILGV